MADGNIPISTALISASLNDTQVAVPPALVGAQRVASLYDLMDMGYDSDPIREHSRQLGHVPIIPHPKRGAQPAAELEPHEAIRFRHRTGVERAYSSLKEAYGGRFVRVRGHAKVMAHLMFGVLALTANQLYRLAVEPTAGLPSPAT